MLRVHARASRYNAPGGVSLLSLRMPAHVVPRVAYRGLGTIPAELRATTRSAPITLQVRFDFVEHLALIVWLGLPSVLVCGSVLIVVFLRAHERALRVIAPPELVLN